MNWRLWKKKEKKEKEEKTVDFPKPNEVWFLKSVDGSPWPNKMWIPTTVLDVKGGWVRYKIGNGVICRDERKTVKEFISLYQKDVNTSLVIKHKNTYDEWMVSYLKDRNNDDRGHAYPIVRAAFEAGRNSVET